MIQLLKKILGMLRFHPHPRQMRTLEAVEAGRRMVQAGSLSYHSPDPIITVGIDPDLIRAINDAKNTLQEIYRMLVRGELEVKALPHHRQTFQVKENLLKRIDQMNTNLISALEDSE